MLPTERRGGPSERDTIFNNRAILMVWFSLSFFFLKEVIIKFRADDLNNNEWNDALSNSVVEQWEIDFYNEAYGILNFNIL